MDDLAQRLVGEVRGRRPAKADRGGATGGAPLAAAPDRRAGGAGPVGAGSGGGSGRATSDVDQVATQRSSAVDWPSAGRATAKATTPVNSTWRILGLTPATIDMRPPRVEKLA